MFADVCRGVGEEDKEAVGIYPPLYPSTRQDLGKHEGFLRSRPVRPGVRTRQDLSGLGKYGGFFTFKSSGAGKCGGLVGSCLGEWIAGF